MCYTCAGAADKPMLIIHGEDEGPQGLPANVKAIRVKPRFPFGKHHTKMMVVKYEDESVRVVVSTANLVGEDWRNRTQGLWVGPKCPKLTDDSPGESKTGFKNALLDYLRFYEVSPLRPYVQAVSQCDFSGVNVHLVASVPGSHRGPELDKWGHRRLAAELRKGIKNPPEDLRKWPTIAQCSSIGSLGHNENAWLAGEFARALTAQRGPASGGKFPLRVIYPSRKDVEGSYDSLLGGGCLPYSGRTHAKQAWLEPLLRRWKAECSNRTRAMPHIKTYTRINADASEAAYLLLTSANLSKAAWGTMNKAGDALMVNRPLWWKKALKNFSYRYSLTSWACFSCPPLCWRTKAGRRSSSARTSACPTTFP